MKHICILGFVFVMGAFVIGCQPATRTPSFVADLSGSVEVPSVETSASGKALFYLSKDGTRLEYDLMVKDLKDVTMAHLHEAPADSNGEVVVWLYPEKPEPRMIQGTTNGNLARGTITAARLIGPLQGKTIADLVTQIEEGNIYVNVHTEANPEGEIRGQVHTFSGT